MFKNDEVAAIFRNENRFRKHLEKHGKVVVEHGSKLELAMMELLGEGHADELEQVATLLGFDYSTVGNTYLVLLKTVNEAKQPKVYAPGLVLRQGTLQLRWGQSYRKMSDIVAMDGVTVLPSVVVDGQYTKYVITLALENGADVNLRLFLKDGCKLSTAQMLAMLKSGNGWSEVLNAPRPTDIKKVVSASQPVFSFVAVGSRDYVSKGENKGGQKYEVAKTVLVAENGDEFEMKVSKGYKYRDFCYWANVVSEDNPVEVRVEYLSEGDFNGEKYNEVAITYEALNSPDDEEDFDELEQLDDDYEDFSAAYDPDGF